MIDKEKLLKYLDENERLDEYGSCVVEVVNLDIAISNGMLNKEPCEWKLDNDGCYWETGCGKTWGFPDGGTPKENGCDYCPNCGHEMEVKQ